MIYFRRISRTELPEALFQPTTGRIEAATSPSHLPIPHGNQLLILWATEPIGAPAPTVVVSPNEMRGELLAWFASFAGGLRPLTAHARVIDSSMTISLEQEQSPVDRAALRSIGTCLMLAEVYSETWPRPLRDEWMTASTLCSTLSFAGLRATAIGHSVGSANRGWQFANTLTKQKPRRLEPAAIVSAVNVATALAALAPRTSLNQTERAILDVCEDLSNFGPPHESVSTTSPLLRDLPVFAELSRQDRVRAFESFAARLQREARSDPLRDFAIGYLASSIDPGKFTFFRIVGELLHDFPTALLWYAVCAGCYPQSVAGFSGNGVAQRAWSHVVQRFSPMDRPIADISLEELEVFSLSDLPIDDYPVFAAGFSTVEIAPGVVVTIRSQRPGEAEEEFSNSIAIERAELDLLVRQATELTRGLERAVTGTRHEPATRRRRR